MNKPFNPPSSAFDTFSHKREKEKINRIFKWNWYTLVPFAEVLRVSELLMRKPIQYYITVVTIYLTMSVLAGCGFHLRGPVTLPPSFQTVYIQSNDSYNDLSLQLRQALYDVGAKVLPTPDNSQINVVIINENQTQYITSIASNSQISVSNVVYSVQFKVTDADNKTLLGPRTVHASRSYSQNTNQLLSVTNNLNILQHDMRAEIVRQIIDQITAPKALYALDVSES